MKKLIPFPYFGGKFHLVDFLLSLFPEHKIYVEVFGGSGVVLLNKCPSDIEIYNDLDNRIANFFRVIRDRDKFKEFVRIVNLCPFSRYEFECFVNDINTDDGDDNDIVKAVKFFVVINQSFAGRLGAGFRVSTTKKEVDCCLNKINNLHLISNRFMNVVVENYDFRKIFELYDTEDTLFYCDPPYISETRRSNNTYSFEITNQDHVDLCHLARDCKGKVVISGYDNDLYNRNLEGFIKHEKEILLSSVNIKQEKSYVKERSFAKECVWVSRSCIEKNKKQLKFLF